MPETEWPEFTVPEGSGIPANAPDGQPFVDAESGSAEAAAGAAPPGAPAGEAPKPAAPAPSPAPDEEMFPKHRYDAVRTENERLQTQLSHLTQLLTAIAPTLQQLKTPNAPPPAPDPVRDKIVSQLYEYVPWLRQAERLAPLADKIEAALERIDQLSQTQAASRTAEQQSWDNYAKHTLAAVHATVAPLIVQPGKSVADLSAFTKQTITDLFVRWVAADQQRAVRYDAHDPKLIEEFKGFYEGEMVSPFKREAAALQTARARKVGNLPVAGQTSSTLGTPPPKPPADEDEDAKFERLGKQGWAMVQDAMK